MAIVLQGVTATVIALSGRYEQILNYVISVDFISFGLTAASLFVFRQRKVNAPQSLYLTPGHPYTTALFVLACAAIVITTTATFPANSAIGLIILLAGIPVYLYWSRAKRRTRATTRPRIYETSPFRLHAVGEDPGPARFNLATSGVGSFPLHELPVTIDQLEINGDSTYGYAPLQHALAKKCGVDPDCVVAAAGTSMANHLAMATLIDPGDEVLIEQPTYELLTSTLLYLGATVKHFARTEESGYALDPAQVRRAITRKTKLIVLTNLHNPSSVLASETALREIGGIGAQRRRAGAGRRSLSRRGLHQYAEALLSSGSGVRRHQQFDQSLRPERPALWMDSRRARSGARHVAAE